MPRNLKSYKGFRVGDKVRITEKPGYWSSLLNTNCPFRASFPMEIVIKEIAEYKHGVSMTCGNYGWSIKELINHNRIEKIEIDFGVEVGKYYYVKDSRKGSRVGKILKEPRKSLYFNNYVAEATFIRADTASLHTEETWCYKSNNKTFREATKEEIKWLDTCIKEGKYLTASDAKNTRKTFPSSGWCPNPSKSVAKYIINKFNDGKIIKLRNEEGIVWNGRSVWKVKNNSSYPKYTNKELEKLLPEEYKPFSWITTQLKNDPNSLSAIDYSKKLNDYPSHHITGIEGLGKTLSMEETIRQSYMRAERERRFAPQWPDYPSLLMAELGNNARKKIVNKVKDDFTQQEPVIVKSTKKKKVKLISC